MFYLGMEHDIGFYVCPKRCGRDERTVPILAYVGHRNESLVAGVAGGDVGEYFRREAIDCLKRVYLRSNT
jgi:hypothetical protein